ncbi:beta-2 adrenergic receptor-like [Patiria miniata]|uniref:G-protein coupled receptors family 1 profile domain-containing protein n=1 Tax=Patiria miniata TaxID=46514 RepID=A0A914BLG4_PATMI|nr:beta-2 adrenergic receptor-like [Patiria miniata]
MKLGLFTMASSLWNQSNYSSYDYQNNSFTYDYMNEMASSYWNQSDNSNTTYADNSSMYYNYFDYSQASEALWYFITVLSVLTCVLVVVLNVVCLIVLHRTRALQEPTKVFMMSLNASDLLSGITVCVPTTVNWTIQRWPFGRILCKIYATFGMQLFIATILSVLLLTIDRYIAIFFPLRYPSMLTQTRARITVCCMWVFILISSAAFRFIPDSEVEAIEFGHCYWEFQSTPYYVAIFTGMILVPTLIVTILYVKIVQTALKQSKRIGQEEGQFRDREGGNPLGRNRPNRGNRKSLITLAVITMSMYVCYTPLITLHILNGMSRVYISSETETILSLNYMTNSWLNVVIYLFRNKDLRKEAKALIKWPCMKNMNPMNG